MMSREAKKAREYITIISSIDYITMEFILHILCCILYLADSGNTTSIETVSLHYKLTTMESTGLLSLKFKLTENMSLSNNTSGKFVEKFESFIALSAESLKHNTDISWGLPENGKTKSDASIDTEFKVKFENCNDKNVNLNNELKLGFIMSWVNLSFTGTLSRFTDHNINNSTSDDKIQNSEFGFPCWIPARIEKDMLETWLIKPDGLETIPVMMNDTTGNSSDKISGSEIEDAILVIKFTIRDPWCNFNDRCDWKRQGEFYKEMLINSAMGQRLKLPDTTDSNDTCGVLFISDMRHYDHESVTLTSPLMMGSNWYCSLKIKMFYIKNTGFLVRLLTSQISYTLDMYRNPRSNKLTDWKTEEIFIGKVNETFRIQVELFALLMNAKIAVKEIMFESCNGLQGNTTHKDCNKDEFQCSTGVCISHTLTCNGQINCLYGEDESSHVCGKRNYSCNFENFGNCTWITINSTGKFDIIEASSASDRFMLVDHTYRSTAGKLLKIELNRPVHVIIKTEKLPALPARVILQRLCKIYFSFYADDTTFYPVTWFEAKFMQGDRNIGLDPLLKKNENHSWETLSFTVQNMTSSEYHLELKIRTIHAKWIFLDDIYLSKDCYGHGRIAPNQSIIIVDDIVTGSEVSTINSDLRVSTVTLELVISMASLIIVSVIAATFIVIGYRKRKLSCKRLFSETSRRSLRSDGNSVALSSVIGSSDMVRRLNHVMVESNPEYDWLNHRTLNEIITSIPLSRINMISLIGEGAFGQVHKASLTTISGIKAVAIKKLPSTASEQAKADFLFEAITLCKFKHTNIVECIGISAAQEHNSLYLVLEYMSGGDMRTFLHNCQATRECKRHLSLAELTSLAVDIARGCWYLEQNKFIHRDIAARNCLLTSTDPSRVAKIADFGLSRDVLLSNYYRKSGQAMLPVRWMPPEAILEGYFSSKSDVWAFGVLLWEIFSYGYIPYPGLSNTEVVDYIAKGRTLTPPSDCPAQICTIMTDCWNQSPQERPNFKILTIRLEHVRKSVDSTNIKFEKLRVRWRKKNTNRDEKPEISPLIEKAECAETEHTVQNLTETSIDKDIV